MKRVAAILTGVAVVIVAALGGLFMYALYANEKERNAARTAPARAARHLPKEPEPKTEVITENGQANETEIKNLG